MIKSEYFKNRYSMVPLSTNCNVCNASVEQCLYQLGFNFNTHYKLVMSPINIKFAQNILNGLGHIEIELDDSLEEQFYVVDTVKKEIIYSFGA